MQPYGPPVDQLLKIKDELWGSDEWQDYRAMGIGLEHVPELIRMAVDEDLNNADEASPEVFGPVHAWRALATLQAEAAIPTLVGILADQQDDEDFDDWICEELPKVLGKLGPSAIPALTDLVKRETAGEYARTDAARSLSLIAQIHPETRAECVGVLASCLEYPDRNDPSFNGSVVSDLIDLDARESAEVIERAYATGLVDDSICGTWFDVWHELELEGEPPPETEPQYELFRKPFSGPADLSSRPASPKSQRPLGDLSAEERKRRNKARQKLEKKKKKQSRKKRR
jgi:hypothetical protein